MLRFGPGTAEILPSKCKTIVIVCHKHDVFFPQPPVHCKKKVCLKCFSVVTLTLPALSYRLLDLFHFLTTLPNPERKYPTLSPHYFKNRNMILFKKYKTKMLVEIDICFSVCAVFICLKLSKPYHVKFFRDSQKT